MARQMYYLGGFGVMVTLILSYKMLNLNMNTDETRKVFNNI